MVAAERMGNNGGGDKRQKERDKGAFFVCARTQLIQHNHDLGCRWLNASLGTKQKKNQQQHVFTRRRDLPAASVCPHTHARACLRVAKLQPAPSSTVQRLSPVEASLTRKQKKTKHKKQTHADSSVFTPTVLNQQESSRRHSH